MSTHTLDPSEDAVVTTVAELFIPQLGGAVQVRYTVVNLDPNYPTSPPRIYAELWHNTARDGGPPVYRRYVGELR